MTEMRPIKSLEALLIDLSLREPRCHSLDTVDESVRVGRIGDDTVRVVVVANATGVGRDEGNTASHRFQQDQRRAFGTDRRQQRQPTGKNTCARYDR